MDIIEQTEETGVEKVICVKNDSRGSRIRAKKATVPQVVEEEPVQYALDKDGRVAVACRVVKLEDVVSTSYTDGDEAAQASTTLYTNALNGESHVGLCLVSSGHYKSYPVGRLYQKGVATRTCASRNKTPATSTRNDKRRLTHNEVERRRRDKINHWILKLSKIIPDYKQDTGKSGFESQSKCCILAKAFDYITELKEMNKRLLISVKQNDELMQEMDTMTEKVEQLSQENQVLKATLTQHGLLHQP